MRSSLNLGKIAGININIHVSWLFVFFLLSWSLATDFFPNTYRFSTQTSWILALISALLLFSSVLLHELSHSLVSKAHKLHVESITLFFFGGLASIGSEPKHPRTEFLMAISGPVMSILIGLVSFALFKSVHSIYFLAVLQYLYSVNFALAAFNMIPGYPLDGGRVLRSALWAYFKDIKKATRIASTAGVVFGYCLVSLGVVELLYGGFGLWYIFLGGFLVLLAKGGYEQVVIKERMKKLSLKKLVYSPHFVKESDSLMEFLRFCKENTTFFALVNHKGTLFVMDLLYLEKVPKQAWHQALVGDVMKEAILISLQHDIPSVFELMRQHNIRILPVIEKKKLVGVIDSERIAKSVQIMSQDA